MTNLGQNYADAGRLTEAVPLLEEALTLCKEKLGPRPDDAPMHEQLGRCPQSGGASG